MKYAAPISMAIYLVLFAYSFSRENIPITTQSGNKDVQVVQVSVDGEPNSYTFSVRLKSDDTGCSQYADWWEVVDTNGQLIYRRILGHSHPGEQPFTRSGGPVPLAAEQVVIVRGHMNPSGYGHNCFKGSVKEGFQGVKADPDFAANLERNAPLPEGCAF